MQKWLLYIGSNKDVTVDERGNLTGENNSNIIEMDEKKALKEAYRRTRKMRCYLVGQNVNQMMAFDMFPRRYGPRSLFKLGRQMTHYAIHMFLDRLRRKARKEL